MTAKLIHPGHLTRRARKVGGKLIFYGFVAIFMIVVLLPIYDVLLVAFAPGQQFFTTPLTYFPRSLEIVTRYREIFAAIPIPQYLLNTLFLATVSSVVALIFSFSAAYAIVRLRVPGGTLVLMLLMGSTMLPPVASVIPLFQMFQKLKLLNTLPGLLILYTSILLPVSTWALAEFIRQVPEEISDAAKVDGAGFWTLLLRIILPLIRPGLATMFLIDFIVGWNEFFYPLIFAPAQGARVITMAVFDAGSIAQRVGDSFFFQSWGHQMATAILAILPVFLLTLVFQRQIVGGITSGAVK